jgi:hypothetical protein
MLEEVQVVVKSPMACNLCNQRKEKEIAAKNNSFF